MGYFDVRLIIEGFRGRLEDGLIDDAASMVEFGESKIGFELLCDNLFEYGSPISEREYFILLDVGVYLCCDVNSVRFECLKVLLE